MTTLISRLFPDEQAAQVAADRLILKGVPRNACTIIAAGDKAEGQLGRARLHQSTTAPYSKGLAAGNAVLVVKATYKPLGAVRLTKEILAKYDTVSVGKAVQEHKLPWEPDHAKSVLKDHPLFLSIPTISMPHGPVTSNFGMRMTKPHRAKRPLTNRRMSRIFWPMKLVSKKNRSSSVMHGGRAMSRMFWPMPLLSTKQRSKSVIPRGGFPFSRLLGMRTTSSKAT